MGSWRNTLKQQFTNGNNLGKALGMRLPCKLNFCYSGKGIGILHVEVKLLKPIGLIRCTPTFDTEFRNNSYLNTGKTGVQRGTAIA